MSRRLDHSLVSTFPLIKQSTKYDACYLVTMSRCLLKKDFYDASSLFGF